MQLIFMARNIERHIAIGDQLENGFHPEEPIASLVSDSTTVEPYTGSKSVLRAISFTHVQSNNPDAQLIQLMEEPPTPLSAKVPASAYFYRLGFGLIE